MQALVQVELGHLNQRVSSSSLQVMTVELTIGKARLVSNCSCLFAVPSWLHSTRNTLPSCTLIHHVPAAIVEARQQPMRPVTPNQCATANESCSCCSLRAPVSHKPQLYAVVAVSACTSMDQVLKCALFSCMDFPQRDRTHQRVLLIVNDCLRFKC